MLEQQKNQLMAYLRNEESQIEAHIANQGGVAIEARLGIYRNAYNMRLRESIEVDHPVLGVYLGDDLFDLMAAEYVKHYPSSRTSLRHFADQLPGFLARTEPFCDHGQIPELARFERLLMTAFDAAEENRVANEALAELPVEEWPDTTLSFHSSMQIFSTQWNVVEMWQAIREEREPPPPIERTNHWLVWRNSKRLTEFTSITGLEAELLQRALQGKNLAKLCEFLAEHLEENRVAETFLQIMRSWLSKGTIT